MTSVLHICTDFWPSTGGIERFVLDLAVHSQSSGLQASVLCLDRLRSHPERLAQTETVFGIQVTRIPFLDFKFYKPALLPLSLLGRHDVLHVHGVGAQLDFAVLTKWLHRKPLVLSTHGGLFHTDVLLRLKRLYFFGLQRLAMPYVDVVAACSKSDAVLFKRISGRVTLVENAVDTRTYLELPRDEVSGRCLYVGRLSENKGIPSLLKAFAFAKNHGASFQLRLVGRDEQGSLERYRQIARDLRIHEHVAFVGEVSQAELLREYQRAAVFVSASHYEGFGLSAIEAKAAGCQLLLHKNAAFTEIFSSDESATLVNFNHPEEAGSILNSVLASPRKSSELRRREVETYSWQRKMTEWRQLYEACLPRSDTHGCRKIINANDG